MADTGEALRAPFAAGDICWRVGSTTADKKKGLALAYIDARAVQRRLDDLFGWDGWRTEYHSLGVGVVCALSVRVDCGDADHAERWITKQDGADNTDIEATKGGISDAFKRVAASGYGIGRYLYALPQEWVALENKRIKTPPQLPAWALPKGDTPTESTPPAATINPRTDAPTPAERGEEDPTLAHMKECLGDDKWVNKDQWGHVCDGVVSNESLDKWSDADVKTGYGIAVKLKSGTPPPHPQQAGPPSESPQSGPYEKCPQCNGDRGVWDNRVRRKEQQAEKAAGTRDKAPGPAWACKDNDTCGWIKWESGDE